MTLKWCCNLAAMKRNWNWQKVVNLLWVASIAIPKRGKTEIIARVRTYWIVNCMYVVCNVYNCTLYRGSRTRFFPLRHTNAITHYILVEWRINKTKMRTWQSVGVREITTSHLRIESIVVHRNWKPQQLLKGLCAIVYGLLFISYVRLSTEHDSILFFFGSTASAEICTLVRTKEICEKGEE